MDDMLFVLFIIIISHPITSLMIIFGIIFAIIHITRNKDKSNPVYQNIASYFYYKGAKDLQEKGAVSKNDCLKDPLYQELIKAKNKSFLELLTKKYNLFGQDYFIGLNQTNQQNNSQKVEQIKALETNQQSIKLNQETVEMVDRALEEKEAEIKQVDLGDEKTILTVQPISQSTQATANFETENWWTNPNVLLTVAGCLLVAAGVSLIASENVGTLAKMITIWVSIMVFYVGGLALMKIKPALKTISITFVGIALALIPLGGIAFVYYNLFSVETTWILISIIGFALYGVAAYLIDNQIISYLTVGFILSIAASIINSADSTYIWYFVVFILISSIFKVITYYLKDKKNVFKQSINVSSMVLTPLMIVAAIYMLPILKINDYYIVFGIAIFDYLVEVLINPLTRYRSELIIRALFSMMIYVLLFDNLYSKVTLFEFVLIVGLVVTIGQYIYSSIRLSFHKKDVYKRSELGIIQAMIICLLCTPIIAELISSGPEITKFELLLVLMSEIIVIFESAMMMNRDKTSSIYHWLIYINNLLLILVISRTIELFFYPSNTIDQPIKYGKNYLSDIILYLTGTIMLVSHALVTLLINIKTKRQLTEKVTKIWLYIYVGLILLFSLTYLDTFESSLVLNLLSLLPVITSVILVCYLAVKDSYKLSVINLINFGALSFAIVNNFEVIKGSFSISLLAAAISLSFCFGALYLNKKDYGLVYYVMAQIYLILSSIVFENYQAAIIMVVLLNAVFSYFYLLYKKDNQIKPNSILILPLVAAFLMTLTSQFDSEKDFISLIFGIVMTFGASIFVLYQKKITNILTQIPLLLILWLFMAIFDYSSVREVIPWQARLMVSLIGTTVFALFGYLMTISKKIHTNFLISIVLGLVALFTTNYFSDQEIYRIISILSVACIGIIFWINDFVEKHHKAFEAGVYLMTFAISLFMNMYIEHNLWIYLAHLWPTVIVIATTIKKSFFNELNAETIKSRFIIAYAILTFVMVVKSLSVETFAIVLLLEQIILLIAGYFNSSKWLIKSCLVVLAGVLLYFVKDISYLVFLILGIIVIGVVIYIMKKQDRDI